MIKRLSALLLAVLIILSFAACGKDKDKDSDDLSAPGSSSVASGTEATGEQANNPLDLTLNNGNIKYVGFQKADPDLTDYDNALIFIFDYIYLILF